MIRRYIIWRNNHAYDERLRRIAGRANVACGTRSVSRLSKKFRLIFTARRLTRFLSPSGASCLACGNRRPAIDSGRDRCCRAPSHRPGPPEGLEPFFCALEQRGTDPPPSPGGTDRKPVQVAAPAIPARDDRADQLAVMLSEDHRIRVTAKQGCHRLARIRRATGVLAGFLPHPQDPVDVGDRSSAQYERHPAILPVGSARTRLTEGPGHAAPAAGILRRRRLRGTL
jgi:hypothetical protein